MKLLFSVMLLLTVSLVHAADRPPKDDHNDNQDPVWLVLHTRLKIGSPSVTFQQRDDINYNYEDFRTVNAGAGLKLQMFRSIYGEYAVYTNLYQQMTSQLSAGIETPTSVVRLGIRYLVAGDQFAPRFEPENRDLQMYVTLGGTRSGLEVALGNLNKIISGNDPTVSDPLTMSDVQIILNIGLWSTN